MKQCRLHIGAIDTGFQPESITRTYHNQPKSWVILSDAMVESDGWDE